MFFTGMASVGFVLVHYLHSEFAYDILVIHPKIFRKDLPTPWCSSRGEGLRNECR